MSEQSNVVFAEVRKRKIVNIVNVKGETTVQQLCDEFEVSPATIRNDLNELERQGLLCRTHGGAISNEGNAAHELTSQEKEDYNIEQKRAIAKAGLTYIKPGAVIMIDTGTTMLELAKVLKGVAISLTVLTNDFLIAMELEQNTNISVFLLGGAVRRGFHCTVGNAVLEMMETLYIDTAFIATNGINLQRGLSTPNMDTANVKRKMISISQNTIVLADSSKVGKDAFATFADLSDIDVMITDAELDREFAKEIETEGMKIVRVTPD